MRINSNNYDNRNANFQATVHFWNSKPNKKLTDETIQSIEKLFPIATTNRTGHMDIILLDRYGLSKAKPDKILFCDDSYADSVDITIKKTNDKEYLLRNLLDVFNKFKLIKDIRESIDRTFQ